MATKAVNMILLFESCFETIIWTRIVTTLHMQQLGGGGVTVGKRCSLCFYLFSCFLKDSWTSPSCFLFWLLEPWAVFFLFVVAIFFDRERTLCLRFCLCICLLETSTVPLLWTFKLSRALPQWAKQMPSANHMRTAVRPESKEKERHQ